LHRFIWLTFYQLERLNDLVRICQNLPIGFNRFEPEDWPVITLDFPRMQGKSLPEGFEVNNPLKIPILVTNITIACGHPSEIWFMYQKEIYSRNIGNRTAFRTSVTLF
jgi:hypothetical protein